MTKPKDGLTFGAGCALSRDMYCMVGAADAPAGAQDAASRLMFYRHQEADRWFSLDLAGWRAQSVCFPRPAPDGVPKVYALGAQGEVECYSSEGAEMEQIADAGPGRVTRIREIGAHLYVCGDGGRVYRREAAGWVRVGEMAGQVVGAWDSNETGAAPARSGKGADDLVDVNSPDEKFLYAVGANGYMAFFTGVEWIEIEKVTTAHLNFILPAADNMIWVAGNRGALLKGNVDLGFFSAITQQYAHLDFHSVAMHDGRLFIGARDGVYELVEYRLRKSPVGEDGALGEIQSIEARDGVLWALGSRKLARHDGTGWEVLENPA